MLHVCSVRGAAVCSVRDAAVCSVRGAAVCSVKTCRAYSDSFSEQHERLYVQLHILIY